MQVGVVIGLCAVLAVFGILPCAFGVVGLVVIVTKYVADGLAVYPID